MSDPTRPTTTPPAPTGLACNIDRRGRRARALAGAALVLIASVMIVLSALGVGPFRGVGASVIAGLVLATGCFCLFEGLVGWCAVRAMGFKTPI